MAIIDDVARSVREAELEEYFEFTVEENWAQVYVNVIFLMGFTQVAVQQLDLSPKLISIWALNALQALWAILGYDL